MASSAAKEQSLISSERTGEIKGDTDVLRRSDCLSHIVYAKVLESDGKVPNSGFLAIDMGYGWSGECAFFFFILVEHHPNLGGLPRNLILGEAGKNI